MYVKSICFLSVFLFHCKQVVLQYGIPIYPPVFPPPVPIIPPPPPVMMAPAMVAIIPSSTEETTTTTKKPIKIYPALPAFCCSVKKKNVSENIYAVPVPVPVPPIVAPPPLVLVPVPPVIPPRITKRKQACSGYSSDDSDSSSSTSSCSSEYYRRGRYRGYGRKRRRRKHYRRSLRSSERNDELLKPMLSFVADNGDVKYETKISNNDVAQLLGKGKRNKNVPKAKDITKEDKRNNRVSRRNNLGRKKMLPRSGASNYELNDGKKQFIIKSSPDRKISNLTVSFNIS